MRNITTLLILLSICACSRERSAACQRYEKDRQIYIDLEAVNDEIKRIKISEVFVIPHSLLLNGEADSFLREQLDELQRIEGNRLVREYEMIPEETYSLEMTMKHLGKEHFVCEH